MPAYVNVNNEIEFLLTTTVALPRRALRDEPSAPVLLALLQLPHARIAAALGQ